MATYEEIQDLYYKLHGRVIKTCWIAHVKELNNLPVRQSPNRISPDERTNPCPDKLRPLIEDAMRRLNMLK